MIIQRNEAPARVSMLFDGRPVRWARNVVGDYDGWGRTLEVFNADVQDQLALLKRLSILRNAIELAICGPLIVIFHTPEETKRLYSEVLP